MRSYGLSEDDVKRIVQRELDKNPDLKYYINNPYIEELIILLIDGICSAIVENNERIIDDLNDSVKTFRGNKHRFI